MGIGSTANIDDRRFVSEIESGNDLARYCLELDPAETKRALAWVNSICFVYLLIGVLGLRPGPPVINRHAVQEEAIPTVIEPLVPVQQITADTGSEQTPSEQSSEESSIVAVTIDSPAVAFAVPTVGNLVVPTSLAQAPPANPMQGAVSVSGPHIEQIGVTGVGGTRPIPPYPRESLMNREQGTVVLLIEAGPYGKILSVTVKESSGYWRLDQSTVDYVKRHWIAPGKGMFEAPIVYELK